MPINGFMMLLCLIGLLTAVYFIGSFLDFATDYFPNFILYVIGTGIAVYVVTVWTQHWLELRRRSSTRTG
jgi:hypothetical protein